MSMSSPPPLVIASRADNIDYTRIDYLRALPLVDQLTISNANGALVDVIVCISPALSLALAS